MISTTPTLPATLHRVLSAPATLVGSSWQLTRSLARTVTPWPDRDGDRSEDVDADADTELELITSTEPLVGPSELTTGELLIEAQRPLGETGDRSRAARARRLAHTYLQRRQQQLRADLDDRR